VRIIFVYGRNGFKYGFDLACLLAEVYDPIAMDLDAATVRISPVLFARRLGRICQMLGELPEGAQWVFLRTPKGSLSGRTPIEALLAGEYASVKVAAEGYAER
jgi:hypothetical protein